MKRQLCFATVRLEVIEVGKKPISKMSTEQRAKQFAPFDALKGFSEVLREREKIKVSKKILSEDKIRELNDALLTLKKGENALVIYYNGDEYIQTEGTICKLNFTMHCLILDDVTINFEDLLYIENKP